MSDNIIIGIMLFLLSLTTLIVMSGAQAAAGW